MSSISRRELLLGSAVVAAGSAVGGHMAWRLLRQPKARVAVVKASAYDIDLVDLMVQGIRQFPQVVERARGVRVVLKPNLVEWNPSRPINTHPRVVASAARAFQELDAAEVVVAEGPGHRRDTELLLHYSGVSEALEQVGVRFVDINVDDVVERALPLGATGLDSLKIGATAATADLLVSLPKLKTHHWAGVTLSMKNLFGTVPGSVYGWPKNPLHQVGIWGSILDLWGALQPGFAIVDGITGMEGDGPIMGSAVHVGALVMGDNLPAVDATAARLMGLDAHKIPWLARAAELGGTVSSSRIELIGDTVQPVEFALLEHWKALR